MCCCTVSGDRPDSTQCVVVLSVFISCNVFPEVCVLQGGYWQFSAELDTLTRMQGDRLKTLLLGTGLRSLGTFIPNKSFLQHVTNSSNCDITVQQMAALVILVNETATYL